MKTSEKLDRVLGSKNWWIEEDHSTESAYFPISYFTLKGPPQIASGQPVYFLFGLRILRDLALFANGPLRAY